MEESQLTKWREERVAREKARLDKLRQLNKNKYKAANEEKMAGPNKIASSASRSSRKSLAPPKVSQINLMTTFKKEEKAMGSSKSLNINKTSRKTIAPFVTQSEINLKTAVKKEEKAAGSTKSPKMNETSSKAMAPSVTQVGLKSQVNQVHTPSKITKILHKSSSTSEILKKTDVLTSRKSIIPNMMTKTAETGKTLMKPISETRKSMAPPDRVQKPQVKPPLTVSSSSKSEPKLLPRKSMASAEITKKTNVSSRKSMMPTSVASAEITKKTNVSSRKSMMPTIMVVKSNESSRVPNKQNTNISRKSIIPLKTSQTATKAKASDESVFDRLYKPRKAVEKPLSDFEKLQSDSKFRDKLIKDTCLILNKRHTVFEQKPKPEQQVRRSISAVHFKRISKSELANCIHKWSSSENINNSHLEEINEDDSVKEDKVVSAVKSERKKVKFQKPIYMNFNSPKPEELQSRLNNWLQKRGKSINSYHHLQCFGLHHLAQKQKQSYDEEDKENIAVESDSDNDSFSENMDAKPVETKWRRASYISSTEFDDTQNTIESVEVEMHNVDDLLLGALNDLTELLREGFDWEQCARWLRAIREHFPVASETAAYWECRAALEERQGNLPQTLQCWEEAVAKGTESSVLEANLDQLLDKFMQLKISPNSAKKKKINPKMIDVKNAFKSTIIRFAVQQAKIRQSTQYDHQYTVTPVRRSNRLSCASAGKTPRLAASRTPRSNRTPLVQICSSMRHIDESIAAKTKFVPNDTLPDTP